MLTPSFATDEDSLRILPPWPDGRSGFPHRNLGLPGGRTHRPKGGWKEGPGHLKTGASPREEEALRKHLEEGGALDCPRCDTPLRMIPIPPHPDVSYVRTRVLLLCDSCGLRVALDKR